MDKYYDVMRLIPRTKENKKCVNNIYSFDELNQIINDMPSIRIISKTDTIARIFGRTRDENFISDWLAYLIQSDVRLLEMLFNHFFFEGSDTEYELIREYQFENGRRIDILIMSETFVIGIENKVDSGLQPNQLKDYGKSIRKLAGDKYVLMILLKPENNIALATHDFVNLSYKDLSVILREVKVNFIEDLRLAFLLQDFIIHLEENFMGNNQKYSFNDWTFFIGEHQDKIKTIQEEGKKESLSFMEYIKNELHDLVDYSDDWDFSNYSARLNFLQFYKKVWKQDVDVHYELFIRQGIFLPEEIVIRIDIEGKALRSVKNEVAAYLGLPSTINIVSDVIEIDYSSEESINNSVDQIKSAFTTVIKKYTELIDSWYKSQ